MPCVMKLIKKFKENNKKITSLFNHSPYLHELKKLVTIFLFAVICFNHLNILESLIDYGCLLHKENTPFSNSPSDEENTEKETKTKDQLEEEKYFSRNHFVLTKCFELSDKEKFIFFSTQLNLHPFHDQKQQPPKAA